jgi:hypothetical protein
MRFWWDRLPRGRFFGTTGDSTGWKPFPRINYRASACSACIRSTCSRYASRRSRSLMRCRTRSSERTRVVSSSLLTGLVRKSSAGLGFGFQRLADFVAAHLRHHDVEQQQIGLPASDRLQRLLAVVHHVDCVAFLSQIGFQQFTVLMIVVCDQNSRRRWMKIRRHAHTPIRNHNVITPRVDRLDSSAAPHLGIDAKARSYRTRVESPIKNSVRTTSY